MQLVLTDVTLAALPRSGYGMEPGASAPGRREIINTIEPRRGDTIFPMDANNEDRGAREMSLAVELRHLQFSASENLQVV